MSQATLESYSATGAVEQHFCSPEDFSEAVESATLVGNSPEDLFTLARTTTGYHTVASNCTQLWPEFKGIAGETTVGGTPTTGLQDTVCPTLDEDTFTWPEPEYPGEYAHTGEYAHGASLHDLVPNCIQAIPHNADNVGLVEETISKISEAFSNMQKMTLEMHTLLQDLSISQFQLGNTVEGLEQLVTQER